MSAQYHPEYGNVVTLSHGFGIETRYAHLSANLVAKGERDDQSHAIAKRIRDLAVDRFGVRDAADIVDFVQQVTPLKLAGARYKGLCPFHGEKTPSFHVYDKGLFKCYGCGVGGDLFAIVPELEKQLGG